VLSPRWVMWQEAPAARIVKRSSLQNCAVEAVPIFPPSARPLDRSAASRRGRPRSQA